METQLTHPNEPGVVSAELVKAEIGTGFDDSLVVAQEVARSITDDASRDRAVELGLSVKAEIERIEEKRRRYYEPAYRLAESLRELFDPRIKRGKEILRLLSAGVTEYKVRKDREARLAREKAEAEARRQKDEAERKQREYEAEQRRIQEEKERRELEAAEAKRREEEEARRKEEARKRAEAEARQKEEAERQRKLREEEEARLNHAREAEDVGNGHKVDAILDRQTPIAPFAPDLVAKEAAERQRREEEAEAQRQAEAKAQRAREEAERRRQEEEKEQAQLAKIKEDADKAAANAAAAGAMVAATTAVVAVRPDDRTRSSVLWKWALKGVTEEEQRAAFLALARAVLEGRAPVEYLGWDPERPERFRPVAIGKDVTRLKGEFACDGIEAYPEEKTDFVTKKKEAY